MKKNVEIYYGVKVYWSNNKDRRLNYCVYKLIFPSGRIYIGCVSRKNDNVESRIREHCRKAMGGNTLSASVIRNEEQFKVEIIRICKSSEEAREHEKYQINGYAREVYNMATNTNTYYNSYNKYKGIINKILLNDKCL